MQLPYLFLRLNGDYPPKNLLEDGDDNDDDDDDEESEEQNVMEVGWSAAHQRPLECISGSRYL